MKKGKEPTCLIDFWIQETVKELTALSESGETTALPPPNTSDVEIKSYVFDFLFAAHDASTSSLLQAVTLLDQHPEVLAKVREEVKSMWLPESDSLITGDQIAQMKYTHAVAREILRYKAPAPLVPHIATKDFLLNESYTIPKGTIVLTNTVCEVFFLMTIF